MQQEGGMIKCQLWTHAILSENCKVIDHWHEDQSITEFFSGLPARAKGHHVDDIPHLSWKCAWVTDKAGENAGIRAAVLTLDKTVRFWVWRHSQGSGKRPALDFGCGSSSKTGQGSLLIGSPAGRTPVSARRLGVQCCQGKGRKGVVPPIRALHSVIVDIEKVFAGSRWARQKSWDFGSKKSTWGKVVTPRVRLEIEPSISEARWEIHKKKFSRHWFGVPRLPHGSGNRMLQNLKDFNSIPFVCKIECIRTTAKNNHLDEEGNYFVTATLNDDGSRKRT